jgi:hypothetical protein
MSRQSKVCVSLTFYPSNHHTARETLLVFRHLFNTAAFLLQLDGVEGHSVGDGWQYTWKTEIEPERVMLLINQCHKPLMEVSYPHLIGQRLSFTVTTNSNCS